MAITDRSIPKTFGMFNPIGHVLASFPDDSTARVAAKAFVAAGFADTDVHFVPAAEVVKNASADIANVGILASIGQDLNLVKDHLSLAQRDHGFVGVATPNRGPAEKAAEIARSRGADPAKRYGRFVVEEMIEPGTGETQVAESPSRGLDSQTPSGVEKSR